MPPASLGSWTKEAESLETAKNLLYFKQLVGLKFDKRRLAALEGRTKTHYTRYLRDHGGDAHAPRGLFLMSVSAVGNAETFNQFLELHQARPTNEVSIELQFFGDPPKCGACVQFASTTDH